MYTQAVSQVNLDDISSSFGAGTQKVEDSMQAQVDKIQNAANPSQADLMTLQAITIKWQSIVQSQSSVMKVIGDVMKAVVNNIGS
mgnify:CR=1 FL=1